MIFQRLVHDTSNQSSILVVIINGHFMPPYHRGLSHSFISINYKQVIFFQLSTTTSHHHYSSSSFVPTGLIYSNRNNLIWRINKLFFISDTCCPLNPIIHYNYRRPFVVHFTFTFVLFFDLIHSSSAVSTHLAPQSPNLYTLLNSLQIDCV